MKWVPVVNSLLVNIFIQIIGVNYFSMNRYLELMEWVSTDGEAWIAIPPSDSEVFLFYVIFRLIIRLMEIGRLFILIFQKYPLMLHLVLL